MAQTGNHGAIIPQDRELLYHLYWVEEMGLPQIGARFGVNHKSVLRLMRKLEIPRRGKGISRHHHCVEDQCNEPVYRISHKANGSRYGRRCKAHWTQHRKRLQETYIKQPAVKTRRNNEHARWYYSGPKQIEGEQQWIQHGRRLLRAAKRLSVDPAATPEVCLSRKLELKPDQTSQTLCRL